MRSTQTSNDKKPAPVVMSLISERKINLLSVAALDDMDLILVVQTLIHKCMENENLCNECFLQLIKQTTDTKSGIFVVCINCVCYEYLRFLAFSTLKKFA
jgi:MyTH4 domain